MSGIVDRMLGNKPQSPNYLPTFEEPQPREFQARSLKFLQFILSPGSHKENLNQLFQPLLSRSFPLSFEIAADPESIVIQFACPERDTSQLLHTITAHAPNAVIREAPDFIQQHWTSSPASLVVDFGLYHEFLRPLKINHFDPDPLLGLFAAISNLQSNESAAVQILFQRCRYPWADSMLRAVSDLSRRDFFLDAPELLSLTKQKTSQNLNAVAIRMGVCAQTAYRLNEILQNISLALASDADPQDNFPVPLENEGYPDEEHEYDFLSRQTRRTGMILNDDELLSFVHLPSSKLALPKLFQEQKLTKAAPAIALGYPFVLGKNTHQQTAQTVTLSLEHRLRHTHIIGASGTGKSTLLLHMITQDMQQGNGIAVLDPHGDLVDDVLANTPEHRITDVIVFDPSDEEFPIPFNILSAHSESEKILLASDLVGVFRRLSTNWGDQMNSVLANAIIAFLESKTGGTLADLRRFLIEPEYRKQFLTTVTDPEIVYYWQKEFSFLSGKPQGPILTRLDTFLRPKVIRNMVCQKENRLDFRAIMDGKQIFLAKLSHGAIGEENAYLLGSFIVSKLHQAAMARQNVQQLQRNPFFLYIDEFHHFITPSLASAISGDRKYHLGLILAHQELRQLSNRDTDVAGAVMSNPYTRICFRVGDADAQKLKDGFSSFEAKDLMNLGTGEAICRVERAEYDFNLTVPKPPTLPSEESPDIRRERILNLSKTNYAKSIEKVLIANQQPQILSLPAHLPEQPLSITPIPASHRTPITTPSELQQGRGGQQHKYLQHLLKRIAEEKGFRATIEQHIPESGGSIDVALAKEDLRIACEISVASTPDQELANISKCADAGYPHIFLITSTTRMVNKFEEMTRKLDPSVLAKLSILTPEQFPERLGQIDKGTVGTTNTVKGYKVKVQYQALAQQERNRQEGAVGDVIMKALRRLQK